VQKEALDTVVAKSDGLVLATEEIDQNDDDRDHKQDMDETPNCGGCVLHMSQINSAIKTDTWSL